MFPLFRTSSRRNGRVFVAGQPVHGPGRSGVGDRRGDHFRPSRARRRVGGTDQSGGRWSVGFGGRRGFGARPVARRDHQPTRHRSRGPDRPTLHWGAGRSGPFWRAPPGVSYRLEPTGSASRRSARRRVWSLVGKPRSARHLFVGGDAVDEAALSFRCLLRRWGQARAAGPVFLCIVGSRSGAKHRVSRPTRGAEAALVGGGEIVEVTHQCTPFILFQHGKADSPFGPPIRSGWSGG
jgi:hypothetical protein